MGSFILQDLDLWLYGNPWAGYREYVLSVVNNRNRASFSNEGFSGVFYFQVVNIGSPRRLLTAAYPSFPAFVIRFGLKNFTALSVIDDQQIFFRNEG